MIKINNRSKNDKKSTSKMRYFVYRLKANIIFAYFYLYGGVHLLFCGTKEYTRVVHVPQIYSIINTELYE